MTVQLLDLPPPGWDNYYSGNGSLFQSSAWHAVLKEGLGATSKYLCDSECRPLTSITVFQPGPFRIGYAAFPVGRLHGAQSEAAFGFLSGRDKRAVQLPLDSLRITVSGFTESSRPLDLPFDALPETAIADLQKWDGSMLSSPVRRNVRKALREQVAVDCGTSADAAAIWRLYCGTIGQHNGLRRYTEAYFHALVALSEKHERIVTRVARYQGNVIAYFISVLEGEEAIYLHGGFDRSYSAVRPSDLLYLDAIQDAKKAGYQRFNFLSSPVEQSDLVRFKEKWGGETRQERVYYFHVRPIRAQAFKYVLKAYRSIRRIVP